MAEHAYRYDDPVEFANDLHELIHEKVVIVDSGQRTYRVRGWIFYWWVVEYYIIWKAPLPPPKPKGRLILGVGPVTKRVLPKRKGKLILGVGPVTRRKL